MQQSPNATEEAMAKSISNKNTVSYEAKFLKKIFSKLSHSPSKVEIGGDGGGGMNSESKANGGVKYSVERKKVAHLPSP